MMMLIISDVMRVEEKEGKQLKKKARESSSEKERKEMEETRKSIQHLSVKEEKKRESRHHMDFGDEETQGITTTRIGSHQSLRKEIEDLFFISLLSSHDLIIEGDCKV